MTTHLHREPVPAGPRWRTLVAGTAWAQHRGIARVEVRVDDGLWQDATLAPEYSIDAWRQWTWRWREHLTDQTFREIEPPRPHRKEPR